MNRKIAGAWGSIFLTLILYLAAIANSLPDHLAVHFDINGRPNGFQTRSVFITTFFCFIFLMNGMFLALFFLIERFPAELINIPWKKYWFATEERKTEAFEKLRSVLGLSGIFICAAFLFTEQVIYQQNTSNPWVIIPLNGGIIGILVLSVFFIALCVIITKPPAEKD